MNSLTCNCCGESDKTLSACTGIVKMRYWFNHNLVNIFSMQVISITNLLRALIKMFTQTQREENRVMTSHGDGEIKHNQCCYLFTSGRTALRWKRPSVAFADESQHGLRWINLYGLFKVRQVYVWVIKGADRLRSRPGDWGFHGETRHLVWDCLAVLLHNTC